MRLSFDLETITIMESLGTRMPGLYEGRFLTGAAQ
jgi:hypothetical protein